MGGALGENMDDCCGVVGANQRHYGFATASTAFDHLRQSVWTTNGRVPADDVARIVPQPPRYSSAL